MILVTGGAGFIGANFVLDWLAQSREPLVNLDKLTYAGNLRSLASLAGDARHAFVRGDIGDAGQLRALLDHHRPRAIVNFAAETHVDRSIRGPAAFIDTNVVGTFALLESTDEVYGSLAADDPAFCEATPFAPNSPYAASKASSDHLVRAWHHTYGLPTLTTNCSNNYGPLQFPEKLIPLMIVNALAGKPLPVYGDGGNVRDWLYVGDHCSAIRAVLAHGRPGETYNVGGNAEMANIDVVRTICRLIDARRPNAQCERLITYVTDRPGHDRRYAIDATRLRRDLGWSPAETFESGMRRTVDWYLANGDWLASVQNAEYRRWVDLHYAADAAHAGAPAA